MGDWIVILLTTLVSLGLGWWVLGRRSVAVGVDRPGAGATGGAEQAPAQIGKNGAEPFDGMALAAPNTKVLPHPEHRVVATLAFDGPPGTVPVQRGQVVIGRHSDDDVRVPDVRVSRHHARLIARNDGGFEIYNLTTVRPEPNPMLVNGDRREHADLGDGDVITLGGVSFRLRLATA